METNKLSVNVSTKTNYKARKRSEEEVEYDEAVSPTTEYLLTKSVTLFILCFFESELPFNVSYVHDFCKNVFCNAHPRLSSIPVDDKRLKVKKWKKVEVNVVEDHIKIPSFAEGLSKEEYSKHFDDYISNLATSQIALDKPLWEVHLFNYPRNNNNNNIGGTLILKFNHAIADGISLMSILFGCLQRADDPTLPLTLPTSTNKSNISWEKQNHNALQKMMKLFNIVPKFIASIFNSFYEFGLSVRFIYSEDDQTPIKSGRTEDQFDKKIFTFALSLNDVKRIKTILGVTVNDVVVGILMLGVRLYMQEINHGEMKKTRSTIIVAINARKTKGYNSRLEDMRKHNTKVPLGNRVSSIHIPIINLQDDDFTNPLKFVMQTHKVIKRKRSTPFAKFLFYYCFMGAIRICGGVSAAASTLERDVKNPSLTFTNLIGPIEKMSVANNPIKTFYFVPTGVKTSLAVSVMSYMEKLTMGLTVEKDFIDDQSLSRCLERSFHMIFQAATTTTSTT